MDIVIVAQYLRNIEDFEGNNSRFVYIAKELTNSKKNNVEIVTSDFSHAKKKMFNCVGNLSDIKITTCHESGYSKNVCLKRFASHKELAKNIKEYLDKRNKPDVIYVAVPSLSVAKVCSDYCKKNNVRFIIDIQDLWPEAFKMIFNIPVISNVIFYPMKKQADYIYKQADEIVAVSDTYVNRAIEVNKIYKNKLSVFLGTDLDNFDILAEKNKITTNDGIIRIAYIGTLGNSYDIKCIIDAINMLNNEGIYSLLFVVMGNGPLKSKFEKYAKERNVKCEFTGKLDYGKMVGKLCSCDIAVNPIKKGSAGSIINKVGDYAAAALPVINTQECEEYRNIVEKYKIGFNCNNGNIEDIAEKIKILIDNNNLREEFGKNNRNFAEKKFDRKKTYKLIKKMVINNDEKNNEIQEIPYRCIF